MSTLSAPAFSSQMPRQKAPKGYQMGQMQQFTPEQMNLFQSLFSHVSPGSYLSRLAGGSEEAFAPYEAQAKKGFGQYMGQLGSRFSQLAPGALSAQKGSGFAQAGSQAAQDFALSLQAQRHGLQREAMSDLQELSQMLLQQQPYQQYMVEKPKSFWQQMGLGAMGGLSSGVGKGLGSILGGLF